MEQEYGTLRVKVRRLSESVPIVGATVIVVSEGETFVIITNSLGTSEFTIKTPPAKASQAPSPQRKPYASCDIRVVSPDTATVMIIGEQVFSGIVTTCEVAVPTVEQNGGKPEKVTVVPPHKLHSPPRAEANTVGAIPTVGMAERQVLVPETITVHLGPPGQEAENITVPFLYYLKSVAASEIYPTWPTASLTANILCQISLALNRIYTEWYRSQGYPFQITSSTAFDQYFVPDRGTFESTDTIIDGIFTNYLARSRFIEPLFAEYCDGASVTCNGLSQWGTVPLARRGFDALEICRYYFGREIEIRVAETVEIDIGSFPGELSPGTVSEDVSLLQYRLNRVAVNFPSIPFVGVENGRYGERTTLSVSAFQRLFGLPETGTVDSETWYRLLYIYTAVKKLAELGSEGEAVQGDTFNGRTLQIGDRGSEVLRIEFYLQSISTALGPDVVPPLTVSGVFDDDTRAAVLAFQTYYGISPTGTVNRSTWDGIVNTYYALGGAPSPLPAYPGAPIRRGASGDNVLYIQRALNAIRAVEQTIREVAADSVFGPQTEAAVKEFQRYYGLVPDGIVGPLTWEALTAEYSRLDATDTSVG